MPADVPCKMNAQPEASTHIRKLCFHLLMQPLFFRDHHLSLGHLSLVQSHCSKSSFPMVSRWVGPGLLLPLDHSTCFEACPLQPPPPAPAPAKNKLKAFFPLPSFKAALTMAAKVPSWYACAPHNQHIRVRLHQIVLNPSWDIFVSKPFQLFHVCRVSEGEGEEKLFINVEADILQSLANVICWRQAVMAIFIDTKVDAMLVPLKPRSLFFKWQAVAH